MNFNTRDESENQNNPTDKNINKNNYHNNSNNTRIYRYQNSVHPHQTVPQTNSTSSQQQQIFTKPQTMYQMPPLQRPMSPNDHRLFSGQRQQNPMLPHHQPQYNNNIQYYSVAHPQPDRYQYQVQQHPHNIGQAHVHLSNPQHHMEPQPHHVINENPSISRWPYNATSSPSRSSVQRLSDTSILSNRSSESSIHTPEFHWESQQRQLSDSSTSSRPDHTVASIESSSGPIKTIPPLSAANPNKPAELTIPSSGLKGIAAPRLFPPHADIYASNNLYTHRGRTQSSFSGSGITFADPNQQPQKPENSPPLPHPLQSPNHAPQWQGNNAFLPMPLQYQYSENNSLPPFQSVQMSIRQSSQGTNVSSPPATVSVAPLPNGQFPSERREYGFQQNLRSRTPPARMGPPPPFIMETNLGAGTQKRKKNSGSYIAGSIYNSNNAYKRLKQETNNDVRRSLRPNDSPAASPTSRLSPALDGRSTSLSSDSPISSSTTSSSNTPRRSNTPHNEYEHNLSIIGAEKEGPTFTRPQGRPFSNSISARFFVHHDIFSLLNYIDRKKAKSYIVYDLENLEVTSSDMASSSQDDEVYVSVKSRKRYPSNSKDSYSPEYSDYSKGDLEAFKDSFLSNDKGEVLKEKLNSVFTIKNTCEVDLLDYVVCESEEIKIDYNPSNNMNLSSQKLAKKLAKVEDTSKRPENMKNLLNDTEEDETSKETTTNEVLDIHDLLRNKLQTEKFAFVKVIRDNYGSVLKLEIINLPRDSNGIYYTSEWIKENVCFPRYKSNMKIHLVKIDRKLKNIMKSGLTPGCRKELRLKHKHTENDPQAPSYKLQVKQNNLIIYNDIKMLLWEFNENMVNLSSLEDEFKGLKNDGVVSERKRMIKKLFNNMQIYIRK